MSEKLVWRPGVHSVNVHIPMLKKFYAKMIDSIVNLIGGQDGN